MNSDLIAKPILTYYHGDWKYAKIAESDIATFLVFLFNVAVFFLNRNGNLNALTVWRKHSHY